ncbi:MAG: integrase arm-type DNA-binding domain-containing protein, partial [Acetobacteraceae bacterium]
MAERKRIGLREARSLQPGETVWDSAVPGFHARRQKGPAVSYALFYRTAEGRQRWFTIGRHGAPWTPDLAREEARRILGEVVKGTDPAAEKRAKRHAITMADLCARYLADAEAGRVLVRGGQPKKPLTLANDRGRIEGHVLPLL